jgi:hypothetical protein
MLTLVNILIVFFIILISFQIILVNHNVEGLENGKSYQSYDTNTFSFTLAESPSILYSIYNSYQNTFTPKYLLNNYDHLTDPSNYTGSPPGPANIFFIRHGEKPENGYILNSNGVNRASQLPTFINNLGENGFPIFAIVTCLPNMSEPKKDVKNLSAHPEFTIMMVSFLLNIPIFMYQESNVSQPYNGTTALQLFTNTTFIGKNIVVCWEHGNIQSLVNQTVQCYNYLKAGNTITDLSNNSSTVFSNESTQTWWTSHTPVPLQYQYNYTDLPPPINKPPKDVMPYTNYSHLLPYWNSKCFNLVYHLSQTDTDFTFSVLSENLDTSFQGCDLLIGLLQTQDTKDYTNEDNCGLPA